MNPFAPEACHEYLLDRLAPELSYDPARDYADWRGQVGRRLEDLLGLPLGRTPLDLSVEFQQEHADFHETRFTFFAEPMAQVPCHLLTPRGGMGPFPVMICLQGHTTGMHNSLGRGRDDAENQAIREKDRDFALQAVAQGYGALTLEQRCFGERKDSRPKEQMWRRADCRHATRAAFLLGRTMVGERAWDISRAIDALAQFPQIDLARVACMGNSGGGTATYFAACVEPRIAAVMPSCSVCNFADSRARIDMCECTCVPRMLRYFDIGDLACLIAPRPLVLVAGRQDHLLPFTGVEKAFSRIRQIYAAAGASDRCRLIVGEQGHRFYAAQAWPVFRELTGW